MKMMINVWKKKQVIHKIKIIEKQFIVKKCELKLYIILYLLFFFALSNTKLKPMSNLNLYKLVNISRIL